MKKKLHYIIPSAITIIILLLVFILKKIYPFGNNTICISDMGHGYVPAYTQLWDVLHGTGNIFYNFYLGSGSNVYGAIISNGFVSPINWLVGLVSRDNIAGFMSILLVIKMSLIALTSYICFSKIFDKTKRVYLIIASLLYTFSGYALLMYSNIIWMDSWALFPLIVLALKSMMDSGKVFWYTILLALNLMISFYMSWLMLLILVFGGSVVILTYVEKERRKEVATKLLVCTIIALLISFISFLPAYMQSTHSYRLSDSNEITLQEGSVDFKLLHIIMSGTLLYFVFKLCASYKKDKKMIKMYIALLIITIIPIFIEPINKMWHTGSYYSFPYRYGFITVFIMICAMLHYLNNKELFEIRKDGQKDKILFIIISIMAIICIGICAYISTIYKTLEGNFAILAIQTELGIPLLCLIGMEFLITYCIMLLYNENIREYLLLAIVILQILVVTAIFIEAHDIYQINNSSPMFYVYDVNNNMNLEKDTLFKTKDADNIMMVNYPYITKTPAMSTWLHIISSEQKLASDRLGYTTVNTIIMDSGGTIASDILIGNKYIITRRELDSQMYTKIQEYEDLKLYESNWGSTFTKIYNSNESIETILDKDDSVFEIHNDIIKKIYNTDKDTIEILKTEENISQKDEENVEMEFNFQIQDKSELYINMEDYEENLQTIVVNGETINVPQQYGFYEEEYPTEEYYNGILDLGTFEGNVNVVITANKNVRDKIEFAKLDINLLGEIVSKKTYEEKIIMNGNKLKIVVDVEDDNKSLFIPVTYDDGWKCTVNGEETEINRALDTFMSVKLKNGENAIELEFTPSYFNISWKISIITFISFSAICFIFSKVKKRGKIVKICYCIGSIIFVIVVIIFTYKIYINPVINYIKSIL